MTRILVADDQALVRAGFRLILEAQPDLEVVGEAADGAQAVTLGRQLEPDVILMDIRMPVVDGIEATRRLAQAASKTRVLMLTTFDLDDHVYDSFRAGASGFLLKNVPPEQLVIAVGTVAGGGALLAPALTRRLIEQFVTRPRLTSTVPDSLADLRTRARSVPSHRCRALQRRDRLPAVRQPGHGENPRDTNPDQTWASRSSPSCSPRLRNRARATRPYR